MKMMLNSRAKVVLAATMLVTVAQPAFAATSPENDGCGMGLPEPSVGFKLIDKEVDVRAGIVKIGAWVRPLQHGVNGVEWTIIDCSNSLVTCIQDSGTLNEIKACLGVAFTKLEELDRLVTIDDRMAVLASVIGNNANPSLSGLPSFNGIIREGYLQYALAEATESGEGVQFEDGSWVSNRTMRLVGVLAFLDAAINGVPCDLGDEAGPSICPPGDT